MVKGTGTTDGRRPRVVRGRPNWWVILAVSLALMALLVATAGNPKRVTGGSHGLASSRSAGTHGKGNGGTVAPERSASTSRSTTTTAPVAARTSATALASTHPGSVAPTTVTPGTVTTTTAVAATPPTTTTTAAASQPPGDIREQGVIEPPAQRSSSVGFSGSGAMEVSVVWSGSTYLTMQVSCPNGSQNVGGSSAMAASLTNASGSCLATVSEPASESTALTYTITIGPAGG